MVKLASARDFRTYGPGLTRNRYEYINAGLYLFSTVVLSCGFASQFSSEASSGLVVFLIALGLMLIVNFHDLMAHLVPIDFRFQLMAFDPQLAFVEFAVPLFNMLGTLLTFLAVFFIFLQEEKGHGYFKLEKHALNMLVAGPVLWVVGSIHNSCQIYERADGHVQILQQCVYIPFLMGSMLFMISSCLNYIEQSRVIHHGLGLLGLDLVRNLGYHIFLHWWIDKCGESVQDATNEWYEAGEAARWSTRATNKSERRTCSPAFRTSSNKNKT
ncbi:uncharacterized protein DS421_8g227840 [Arachis hypogaea]|nr:uncharacterized protein DS421_8g227840 [Arachis hypogaea]